MHHARQMHYWPRPVFVRLLLGWRVRRAAVTALLPRVHQVLSPISSDIPHHVWSDVYLFTLDSVISATRLGDVRLAYVVFYFPASL